MDNLNFTPFVRYAELISKPFPYTKKVLAYDFRMFFVVSGSIEIDSNDKLLTAHEGDLITIPPATPYRIFYKSKTFSYYILNFDFSENACASLPKAPVPFENFNENEVFSYEAFPLFNKLFILHNAHFCNPFFEEIHHLSKERTENSKHMQSALLKFIILKASTISQIHNTFSPHYELIASVKSYIEENYDKDISNKAIADHFGYHPYYLNTIFCDCEKTTIHKYIDKIRLKNARKMLLNFNIQITDIANLCGFNDASHFYKFFKKYMGITPKQYRNIIK